MSRGHFDSDGTSTIEGRYDNVNRPTSSVVLNEVCHIRLALRACHWLVIREFFHRHTIALGVLSQPVTKVIGGS